MLYRFPGRTLEELDQMDWPRYLRAVEAGNIEDLENVRRSQMTANSGTSSFTREEAERILEHDSWIAEE